MKIAILGDDNFRKEWEARGASEAVDVEWYGTMRTFLAGDADVYVDLLFDEDPERTRLLERRSDRLIIVNEVQRTCRQLDSGFVRFCGWPTLINRPVQELVVPDKAREEEIAALWEALGWQYQLVPDQPGMITPRVLAGIINEAFFALGEQVSTRGEIDEAMKLGTRYPRGPFEWAGLIGLNRIYRLLKRLSLTDDTYQPAPALEEACRN